MLDLRLIGFFASCSIKYFLWWKSIEISSTTTKDLRIIVPACSLQEAHFSFQGFLIDILWSAENTMLVNDTLQTKIIFSSVEL